MGEEKLRAVRLSSVADTTRTPVVDVNPFAQAHLRMRQAGTLLPFGEDCARMAPAAKRLTYYS